MSTNVDPLANTDKVQIFNNKWLGCGVHSEVYEGTWKDRPVAIKLVSRHLHREVQAELEAFCKVSIHPNLVNVLGIALAKTEKKRSPDSEPTYIVTELMEGGSLHASIGKMRLTQISHILVGVANGLAYLHGLDLCCPGLSSYNVLLTKNGEAKIDKKIDLATKGFVTPDDSLRYVAPEKFTVFKGLCKKSDLHSFGMLMWELFANRLPFCEIESSDYLQMIDHITAHKWEAIPPTCPKPYADLIERCRLPRDKRPSIANVERMIGAYKVAFQLALMRQRPDTLFSAHVMRDICIAICGTLLR